METPGRGSVLAERYELQEVIGRGGMADVYRGHDRMLDRPVAVKLMRVVTADEADRARFSAEAKTLARLNHPGLVTVLDAGTSEDHPYLVMQLVEGGSLSDRIAEGALPADEVAAIGRQVADALVAVHKAGVVHRDVKPGNVLLDQGGRAWLTDFGIARLMDDAARHTATGMMIGSPAYLSPEQLRGREVTPASDVYSLGLVLLEAMTGGRGFPGAGVEAAMARLSTGPEIPDSVPGTWQLLFARMTEMEPEDRPSVGQVSQVLDALLTGALDAHSPQPEASETQLLTGVAPRRDDATRVASQPSPQPTRVAPAPTAASRARSGSSRSLGKGLAAVLALVALVVVVAVVAGALGGGGGIPDGVPPELEQPLTDLHDAVEGG